MFTTEYRYHDKTLEDGKKSKTNLTKIHTELVDFAVSSLWKSFTVNLEFLKHGKNSGKILKKRDHAIVEQESKKYNSKKSSTQNNRIQNKDKFYR